MYYLNRFYLEQKHSTKGGYGRLIHAYLKVLIAKLDFHAKVCLIYLLCCKSIGL